MELEEGNKKDNLDWQQNLLVGVKIALGKTRKHHHGARPWWPNPWWPKPVVEPKPVVKEEPKPVVEETQAVMEKEPELTEEGVLRFCIVAHPSL